MDFKKIDWSSTAFICTYQLILLAAFPFYLAYSPPSFGMVMATIVLTSLTGLSITAGYHRFYSHKSYSVNRLVEVVLLFFGTMSVMGSVFEWASKHRLHHRFVDKEQDPYNIKKGILHAHILWMFIKRKFVEKDTIPDLLQNKLLQFQHKHILSTTIVTNLMAFLLVGMLLKDFLGALVMAVGLRIFLVHHFTWFINSLAHAWGAKTYSKEQSAVNNAIIAFFTFGEGYHNYHHVFASDYRNGVKWYQYDPTKWLIWTLSKLGLASNLKTVDGYISRSRIVNEDKYIFLKALRESTYQKRQALERKIIDMSDNLNDKITRMRKAVQEYKRLEKNQEKKRVLKSLRRDIKKLKNSFKIDWKSWRRLEKEVAAHAVMQHHHV